MRVPDQMAEAMAANAEKRDADFVELPRMKRRSNGGVF
jgi:hypothetical protein